MAGFPSNCLRKRIALSASWVKSSSLSKVEEKLLDHADRVHAGKLGHMLLGEAGQIMQDRQVEIHDFLNVRTLDLDRDLRSVVQLRLMHLRNGSAGNRLERKGGKQALDRLPKFGLNDVLGQRPIEGGTLSCSWRVQSTSHRNKIAA